MKFDPTVAWRLKHLPEGAPDVTKLIEDYEVTCKLSYTSSDNPQAIQRAKYWEKKGYPIQNKINELLEEFPVPIPKKKNREDAILPVTDDCTKDD